MITTKQRAQLRALANSAETILQIGKGGITDAAVAQADGALEARELIKGRVLDNAPMNAREAVTELAEKTGADIVQVIGTRFSLYRARKKNPQSILVK